MTARNCIGVFDSGLGGLSVWSEIRAILPHQSICYVADQAHVPYGGRSLKEVCQFAEGITRFLLRQGARILVIASNTTSAAALQTLRRLFPEVPFVGMEPALKPAIGKTRTGVVGVIATQATFQGELFANLMERYAGNAKVLAQACPGFVEAVERGALDTPETRELLRRVLTPMLDARVDQLVLGCTHYPFLRPAIERLVGPGVDVIDPAPSVARRTAQVLPPDDPSRANADQPGLTFFTSGDTESFRQMLVRLIPALKTQAIDVQALRWQGGCLEVKA